MISKTSFDVDGTEIAIELVENKIVLSIDEFCAAFNTQEFESFTASCMAIGANWYDHMELRATELNKEDAKKAKVKK